MKSGKSLLLLRRNHGDVRSVLVGFLELDNAVAQGEQGVVLAHTDILAGVVDGASLADDNVTSFGNLATEDLQT